MEAVFPHGRFHAGGNLMANVMNLFRVVIIVQLFYAFAITLVAYGLPEDARSYSTAYSDLADQISLQSVGSEVETSLQSQTDIPVIELGALVFYSGNILLDLLLNFAFAIPQMIAMIVNGIMTLLSIDTYMFAVVQLFFSVVIMVMYFLGIMELITNLRSGSARLS